MATLKEVLVEVAKPAVSKIVEIQKDFLDGKGEIKYKLVEDGIAKSPATIGDEESQRIYEAGFNRLLGAGNILYKNEEDVGDAKLRGNLSSEEDARAKLQKDGQPVYRIAIDPIDGTGNYSGDKTPGKERQPVHRSLEELTATELASKAVRPGWGSMVAIQEIQQDGDWKSVASAIYESNSADTPDNLQGKMYLAERDKQGVSVINLQTGREEGILLTQNHAPTQRIVEGGFAKIPGQKDGQLAIQQFVDGEKLQRIDFSCVAQSALAPITGKADGFFQGHPNLHDVLSVAHLAAASGLSVLVLDKNGDKQAVQTEKDGIVEIKYPVVMANSPALAIGMEEAYVKAAGFDMDKLTFRNGDWEAKNFEQLKGELLARSAKGLNGGGPRLQHLAC